MAAEWCSDLCVRRGSGGAIALYQDRPTYVLLENSMSTFFGSHPAGNSVLGTNSSISALTRDQMFNYFINRYSPNNIVLSVTGGFNFEELVHVVRKQAVNNSHLSA